MLEWTETNTSGQKSRSPRSWHNFRQLAFTIGGLYRD